MLKLTPRGIRVKKTLIEIAIYTGIFALVFAIIMLCGTLNYVMDFS